MRTGILAVCLVLISVACAGDSVDPVLERLAKVDRFAFGGVGFAGVVSSGEKDFRIILSRRSALLDFERLLSVANAQGKSYALVGIRTLDPARFKLISRPLRNSAEEVVTQRGCIVDHEALITVLKRIDTGSYFLYDSH